ncbi:MAG TPA: hypothetical protein VID72_10850 [Ktedonobacterales bacterium]
MAHSDHDRFASDALVDTRLNLKALRLATHGWSLGNPLVYKPGVADLGAVARELASAGTPTGALVLNDTQASSDNQHATVHAALILPPQPTQAQPVGMLVARGVAAVASAALSRPCAVRRRWDVIVRSDECATRRLCRVAVEQREDWTLVELWFALDQIWAARPQNAQPTETLFARPDWREVLLARTLHALDGQLCATPDA